MSDQISALRERMEQLEARMAVAEVRVANAERQLQLLLGPFMITKDVKIDPEASRLHWKGRFEASDE